MKKIIAFVLCLVMTLAMFGCAGGGSTEPTAKPVETRDYSPYANIVADTQTWYNELMAMPIANENMTEQELRQLCVDAMRMNLTFTWTPTNEGPIRYADLKDADGTMAGTFNLDSFGLNCTLWGSPFESNEDLARSLVLLDVNGELVEPSNFSRSGSQTTLHFSFSTPMDPSVVKTVKIGPYTAEFP